MSEVNIDAALIAQGSDLSGTEERLVEMLERMHLPHPARGSDEGGGEPGAREGLFDAWLIERTGVSEPMPVARIRFPGRSRLTAAADLARLDTMVTVVDAAAFLREWTLER